MVDSRYVAEMYLILTRDIPDYIKSHHNLLVVIKFLEKDNCTFVFKRLLNIKLIIMKSAVK